MIPRALSSDGVAPNFGLLLLRVAVGLSIAIFHGYGKITGGVDKWESIGGSMANINVTFAPVFFGFMAAFAEFVCSLLLILGVLFRPATLLLAFTMLVAAASHLNRPPDAPGAGWNGASHALELLAVYLCLFFTGPGKFSLTARR